MQEPPTWRGGHASVPPLDTPQTLSRRCTARGDRSLHPLPRWMQRSDTLARARRVRGEAALAGPHRSAASPPAARPRSRRGVGAERPALRPGSPPRAHPKPSSPLRASAPRWKALAPNRCACFSPWCQSQNRCPPPCPRRPALPAAGMQRHIAAEIGRWRGTRKVRRRRPPPPAPRPPAQARRPEPTSTAWRPPKAAAPPPEKCLPLQRRRGGQWEGCGQAARGQGPSWQHSAGPRTRLPTRPEGCARRGGWKAEARVRQSRP
mmetsp:Transcript_2022/g.4872  ORF Transcript_2022/g.4872 Transcript_2022/m.4872 type:complete len:263 (+) Transcript_2022:537-1325(+)